MPIPKPSDSEDKDTYISRCMSNDTMQEEYEDKDQRMAVCQSQWDKNQENNKEDKQYKVFKANIDESISKITHDGKDVYKMPVIMIKEGIWNNLNYSDEQLKNSTETWRDVPVTVDHPVNSWGEPVDAKDSNVIEKSCVGRLYNIRYTDNKLKGDIYLDIEKCNKIASEIIEMIENEEVIEVSTGLFCGVIENNGLDVKDAFDIIGNHLALLPDDTGACSVEDGAGTPRINRKQIYENVKMEESKGIFVTLKEKLGNIFKFNEKSHYDIRRSLSEEINNDDDDKYRYIEDVYDDFFIYSDEGDLYKQNYSVNEDEVSLIGDVVRVEMNVEYIPIDNDSAHTDDGSSFPGADSKKSNKNKEESNMDEKIQKVIDNEANAFTEDDIETLEDMDESVLDKLSIDNESDAEEETNKNKTEETQKNKEEKDELKDNKVDEEISEHEEYFKEQFNKEKSSYIKTILDNKGNSFEEDELEDMSFKILRKMSALAKKEDYSASNASSVQNEDDQKPKPVGLFDNTEKNK